MNAITVEPKKLNSALMEDVPEPDPREGSILVEAIAVGVCGADVEIVEGKYGWAPPGQARLILFKEYFHGDNGAGLGASHQTGWSGVNARVMHLFASMDAQKMLDRKKDQSAGGAND